jgi:RNA polymerase sigma-70 factor (ECF subfamily)
MERKQMEALILDEYSAMYRLAFTYVKNEADAMDVVQDSVVKAMTRCGDIRKKDAAKSWLLSTVAHCALDLLRQNKRRTDAEIPERGEDDRYSNIDLEQAMRLLKENEYLILVLHYFEDQTLREIADALDMRESTVKSTLYRALKKLRVHMEEGVDRA